MTFLHWCILLSLVSILPRCANVPVSSQIASHEEILQRDQALGMELAQRLSSRLKFKYDTEILVYLRRLAQTLVDATPELEGSSVGVWLIKNTKGRWYSYGLPGNRIYLPIDMLRALQFENEMAGLVAIQFGHILKKHVVEKIVKENEVRRLESSSVKGLLRNETYEDSNHLEFFGPTGIFTFSEVEEIAAMRAAVGMLYRAGYDVRGLISLYERFRANQNDSPYETNTINKLVEHARQEIAIYAPLRNPIVRSEDFLLIRKRIQHL